MKKIKILFSLLIAIFTSSYEIVTGQIREQIAIDDSWKFHYGDISNGSSPGFNDSSWDQITLPHTWNAVDGYDRDYKKGIGWYRKKYFIPSDYENKRVYLRFNAANLIADVYVNDIFQGTHMGGYSAFIFDITSSLVLNDSNLIAVKIDNSVNNSIAPLSADFTFFGGITRSVELLVTNEINITPLDFASPGVYITQKNVSKTSADIQVRTLIDNNTVSSHTITTTVTIKDADNSPVVSKNYTKSLPALSQKNIFAFEFAISELILWDGRKNPYLYKAEVLLHDGSTLLDSVSQPLGIRFFEVRADSGFYLNGNRYPLYGVNLHEDRIDKGRAISDSDRREDLDILNHELEVTFLRLVHYQHGEYTYNYADKNGIVLWTEIPLIDLISNSETFRANIKEQLQELIRQNYNHPSVCFWGLYNEITKEPGPDPTSLIDTLNNLAHYEDSTRLTTAASNNDNHPVNNITDLISFNKYFGWYYGTSSDLIPWLNDNKPAPLSVPLGLSEYGGGASISHHELFPEMAGALKIDWHPEELQNAIHEEYWKSIRQNPFLWQTSAWVAFDFTSFKKVEGGKIGVNDKGLITQNRQTNKDAFFLYKANWSSDPVLYITSRRYSNRSSASTYVKVYSNCDSVELTINNKPFGSQKSPTRVFLWNEVILDKRINLIRAKGYFSSEIVRDSCIWKYDPVNTGSDILINFQTDNTEIPDGYLADTGNPFSSGSTGRYRFGWNTNNTANTRERNLLSDKLYDSFNHLQKNGINYFWEIELNNGMYLVRLVSGDPAYYDSHHKLLAEGKIVLDGLPSPDVPFLFGSDTVFVRDGRLTISASPDAINSKINFIEITKIDSTNLCRNKSVKQSSTDNDSPAERAIDGNTDGIWKHGSVTHTKEELHPWWEIDLGDIQNIRIIEIWNRTDSHMDRLSSFYVFISDVPFVSQDLDTTLNQSEVWDTLHSTYPNPNKIFEVNRTGRYVRIQLNGENNLSLAEVIIMGNAGLPPLPPSELIITETSMISVTLSWKDNSTDEEGFIIERKTNLGNYQQIHITPADMNSFIDYDITPGIKYTFRAKAFNNHGESIYSNETTDSIPVIQYENVALNKAVKQSSTWYGGIPERAVDGNTDGDWNNSSVTHTGNDQKAWWEVDLGAIYDIATIQVWNRTDGCCIGRLSDFYVIVSDVPFISHELNQTLNQSGVWYTFQSAYPDPNLVFDVNRTGRYVRIQLNKTDQLNLAEVEVMGILTIPPVEPENIALNKTVKQSSTWYDGVPERAVDGNTDGNWNNGSVTHTGDDQNAWWEVDLGAIYDISTIQVWNRTNSCCMGRLSDFYVIVSDVTLTSQDLNSTLNQPRVWYTFQSAYPDPNQGFEVNRTGRYVRIQLNKQDQLNIAEIQVMGILAVPPEELENVALNKAVKQSSTWYGGIPERAVDGNTDGDWNNGSVTHTGNDQNAWWEVDLGAIYDIATIQVWNRTGGCCISRLSDFYVIVSEVPFISHELNQTLNQSGVWYTFQSAYPDPNQGFEVKRTGRYVRIQLNKQDQLNIAEIEVIGIFAAPSDEPENVALGKPVKQSSIVYGGIPERAVDGNTDGEWNNNSVTHTYNDPNAWWEVDLEAIYDINTLHVWNRTDACCVGRLSDFYVIVSDIPFVSQELDSTQNQSGVWYTFQSAYPDPNQGFEVNRTGRYVRIQLDHTDQLNLAEIMVMAHTYKVKRIDEVNSNTTLSGMSMNVILFPVPFNDKLIIEGLGGISGIEIFNVFGEVLLMKECNTTREEIHTEQMGNGIYFIRFHFYDNTYKTFPILKSTN